MVCNYFKQKAYGFVCLLIYLFFMTVTVLAIFETDFKPDLSLGKIMNERLKIAAADLQDIHLQPLHSLGQRSDDLVVYMSYNPKYKIRWRVVNDVPEDVEQFVGQVCGDLGYIHWKTATINVFKGSE
ncbi:hypothetical protein SAMN04488024_101358 [Pedobacter soli]|uniref:Uncharacterized protein n=2 Tax=Pedobacter soli TaxID=390242 RepID=A0A1G6J6U8_9SPHI|nr:hypothetical protein SAMN04488024_101358 [Pedobacter soli]